MDQNSTPARRPADPKRAFFKVQKGDPTAEESNASALTSLMFYSFLMFTVPLLVFFGSKHLLENEFPLDPPYSFLIPVLLTVVSVNAIIVAYAWHAYKVSQEEDRSRKKTD